MAMAILYFVRFQRHISLITNKHKERDLRDTRARRQKIPTGWLGLPCYIVFKIFGDNRWPYHHHPKSLGVNNLVLCLEKSPRSKDDRAA